LPWWGTPLKVGKVEVVTEGDAEPVVIDGVRDPELFAKQLRNSVNVAKPRGEPKQAPADSAGAARSGAE
jgi:hypothetical protein